MEHQNIPNAKAVNKQATNKASLTRQNGSISNSEYSDSINAESVEASNSQSHGLFYHDFSSIPVGIQTKLKIGDANDKYEQEADRVAEQVMRMPEPNLSQSSSVLNTNSINSVQRKCASCNDEEKLVQRKPTQQGNSELSPRLNTQISSLSGGRPMSVSERGFFEPRFGNDFSNVRIHSDSRANNMASSINARAFTLGNNVVFGAGEYSPSTNLGKHLLAHELTHVVQQSSRQTFNPNNPQAINIDIKNNFVSRETIQCWGELVDTPLISPFFRNHPRFIAILDDPQQTIEEGQEGAHVVKLQEALIELNYRLPDSGIDGVFGSETKIAVRNFQLEAGAPPESVDGIVGPDTLRELDQRFATVHRRHINSLTPTGAITVGNLFRFDIPLSETLSEEEFVITSLKHVFSISDFEANILRGEGWGFNEFDPVTEADVSAGFRRVRVRIVDFRTILNDAQEASSGGRNIAERESQQADLENSLHNLTNTDSIYQLNQEIVAKRAELQDARGISIRESGISYSEKQRRISQFERELASLISRRDSLLAQRGITQEIYENQQTDFKQNFAQFAIQVAHRMLNQNEATANVELTRYNNLDNVGGVKDVFVELNRLYQDANSQRALGRQHEFDQLTESVQNGGYAEPFLSQQFNAHRWPNGTRGGNQYWESYWDIEQEAFEHLQNSARLYPVLAHPDLDVRSNAHRYARMVPTALDDELDSVLVDVNESIQQIRGSLNTENIWELEAVVAKAKYELGILDDTVQADIVADGVEEARSSTTIRNILLAAAGIGFGLLALASGPVGWAALAASVAVGSVDAYLTYQDVSFTRAARRTAVDPNNALTSLDSSWVWFALSLVGLGLDVGAAFKIVRGITTTARATRTAAELQTDAIRFVNSTEEVLEEVVEGGIHLPNRTEILTVLESQQTSEILRIVSTIGDANASTRLAVSISENAELIPALIRLEHISGDILRLYSGPLNNVLHSLPDVFRVSDAGNIASNPQLYEMVLSDPRLQRVLMDNELLNPGLLLDDWITWQSALTRTTPPPITSNFPEYLHLGLGRRTRVAGTERLLADIFPGFHSLTNNLAKNRLVLRDTASELVDAFNAGVLPQRVQEALSEVLNRDLVRSARDLERARENVVRAVNNAIGENITDMASFRQMMEVVEQGGSRGAIGEAFSRIMNLIPGFNSARKLSMSFGDVGIEVLNGRRVIIDNYVGQGSILGEIKVGSSFSPDQLLRYKALYENPDILESFFRAARVQGDEFQEIVYVVLPGPSSLGRTPRQYAATIFRRMENEAMLDYSKVYYLDADGGLYRMIDQTQVEFVRTIN